MSYNEVEQVEYRCPTCDRLLMKGKIDEVEIKCHRCKTVTQFKRPRVPERTVTNSNFRRN